MSRIHTVLPLLIVIGLLLQGCSSDDPVTPEDPGASKGVAYTRTTGTSYENSYEFARSIEGEASISPFDVGVGTTGSLSETFSESVTVTEEESTEVTCEISGIEGKTIIFSVWQSVERYSFVDENGEPYTDPNYTFSDLGTIEIRGDHEILQSAIFDYQAPWEAFQNPGRVLAGRSGDRIGILVDTRGCARGPSLPAGPVTIRIEFGR